MGNNITLRKAVVGDAADLAILDNIASFGLSLWFWQGAVKRGKADDAYEWGKQRMANAEEAFGYANAVVAESEGAVVGVAVGYMIDIDDVLPEKALDPVMAPVFELFSKCGGDWLLDNLAVYSQARKRGIGRKLLDDCFRRARIGGAKNICLIAEDGNRPALSLYDSCGFKECDRRACVPFNTTNKSKNWLLLSAEL